MHGIFALQDEITRSIVDTLKLKLAISPSAPPRSTDAYDDYLHGLFYSDKSTEEALRRSLEFFERALKKDPQLSRAWTGIAKSWLWLADAYAPPLEAYPKVREAAVRALQLNDEEAEAHVYLAETKRILDWDLDGAEAEFNRAVEIEPNSTPSNYFIAALYAARGDRDKALQTLEAAIAGWGYRPGDAIAHVHVVLGAHDDAIRELERACEQRSSSLHGVGIAPEFVPLRSDNRFLSILQKIGLEPEKVFAATAP